LASRLNPNSSPKSHIVIASKTVFIASLVPISLPHAEFLQDCTLIREYRLTNLYRVLYQMIRRLSADGIRRTRSAADSARDRERRVHGDGRTHSDFADHEPGLQLCVRRVKLSESAHLAESLLKLYEGMQKSQESVNLRASRVSRRA
jgi:hypothetical protein